VQATIYTVKSGDSLSKIAQQHYGDSTKWRKIFDANKDIIKDPNLIHPGQKLNIPR
jgi:nucleoid-associated protein YgaU